MRHKLAIESVVVKEPLRLSDCNERDRIIFHETVRFYFRNKTTIKATSTIALVTKVTRQDVTLAFINEDGKAIEAVELEITDKLPAGFFH